MTISKEAKAKIKKVLSYFETGRFSDYTSVYVYPDGKGGAPQITYSIGFTQDYNLKSVLTQYIKAGGEWAVKMQPYLKRMNDPSLYKDEAFLHLLRVAGNDPVMQRIQDAKFDELYFNSALKWATEEGFNQPLSLLVIADSFLQSGSIRNDIRMQFATRTPANGGDEKTWIKDYVDARAEWLSKSKREILRKTVYRTNCFKEAIINKNWGLYSPINANGRII